MCNDKFCLDRSHKFPKSCVNCSCSHSECKNVYSLFELISKVTITPACTSNTVHKFMKYDIRAKLINKIGV